MLYYLLPHLVFVQLVVGTLRNINNFSFSFLSRQKADRQANARSREAVDHLARFTSGKKEISQPGGNRTADLFLEIWVSSLHYHPVVQGRLGGQQ